MKAIRIYNFGASDELKLEETSLPEIGEGQVLVQIYDAGVNPIDWKIRSGKFQTSTSLPITLGQDFAGEVLQTGKGAFTYKPGDRVFGFATGSYAEFASISEKDLARIPDSIDYVTAAALPTPGLTAWQALIDEAKIEQGQRILIHGAAGAVGSIAAQIAKWKGLEVTVTAAAEEFSYLKRLGVDLLIDYKTEKFEEMGGDYDVVLELIGGEVLEKSYDVVKKGGILIETAAGLDEAKLKECGIRGVQFIMKHDASELSKLAELVHDGVIRPRVSRVLPLAEASDAQDLSQSGQAHGKIVLQVT